MLAAYSALPYCGDFSYACCRIIQRRHAVDDDDDDELGEYNTRRFSRFTSTTTDVLSSKARASVHTLLLIHSNSYILSASNPADGVCSDPAFNFVSPFSSSRRVSLTLLASYRYVRHIEDFRHGVRRRDRLRPMRRVPPGESSAAQPLTPRLIAVS